MASVEKAPTWILSPVLCPRCRALTETREDPDTGRLLELRCRACPWSMHAQAGTPRAFDPARRADRRTINNLLAHNWQRTSLRCPACNGRVLGKWWPGRTQPLELRCADCGLQHPLSPP